MTCVYIYSNIYIWLVYMIHDIHTHTNTSVHIYVDAFLPTYVPACLPTHPPTYTQGWCTPSHGQLSEHGVFSCILLKEIRAASHTNLFRISCHARRALPGSLCGCRLPVGKLCLSLVGPQAGWSLAGDEGWWGERRRKTRLYISYIRWRSMRSK